MNTQMHSTEPTSPITDHAGGLMKTFPLWGMSRWKMDNSQNFPRLDFWDWYPENGKHVEERADDIFNEHPFGGDYQSHQHTIVPTDFTWQWGRLRWSSLPPFLNSSLPPFLPPSFPSFLPLISFLFSLFHFLFFLNYFLLFYLSSFPFLFQTKLILARNVSFMYLAWLPLQN